MRVGIGFDIHRLVAKRPLFLGGVRVPHSKGLLGHSDADVVLHALCDAILGALGAGDMGVYFPDTDPKWKGVASRRFVEEAMRLAKRQRQALSHADLIVVAEKPKLSAHRGAIKKSLAEILKVSEHQVNVKAKTMEKLGPIGQGKAIAAYAVVTLEKYP